MKIADILNNIDIGVLALPTFQRGYVWKRPQVKTLMNSLYRGYPVGSLLTWTTRVDSTSVRTAGESAGSRAVDLLLDGQQRLTSLYGVMRGKPPDFFDGDESAFANLYFHLGREEFEFHSTSMNSDPLWLHVTDLFGGDSSWISRITSNQNYADNRDTYLQRGLNVSNIRDTDLHIQSITGEDKTTEVVVDIFNRINSGGTKLSRGDLALARIGAYWPDARPEMQKRLAKWRDAGFDFDLDWLLRCMNAVVTDGVQHERLEGVGIEQIKLSLEKAEKSIDNLLETMRSHLFIDSDRIITSRLAFPVMVKYLDNNGGAFPNIAAVAKMMHWYLATAIWGRLTGQGEAVVTNDIAALKSGEPFDALLNNLRLFLGGRKVSQENFDITTRSKTRLYPLLYIMSRIQDSRDWHTGNRLRHHSLSDSTNLELHHIFPKAYLRNNGISPKDVNNLGNIAFQTRETNRSIGSKPPADYMPEVVARWPGALESQWIPTDLELWSVENYHHFLKERRRLLANAANEMLDQLEAGVIPPAEASSPIRNQPSVSEIFVSDDGPDDDEGLILEHARSFAIERGLPAGEIAYEIVDSDTGEMVTLDLAWPDGLQALYTQPVALLIDEDEIVRRMASDNGFRVFTSLYNFRRYVEREIFAEGQ